MSEIPVRIQYTTKNTNFDRIINILSEVGFNYFCIFGGSLRDSDENQKYKCNPKDYDIRIWSDKTEEKVCSQLSLRSSLGAYTQMKCEGTKHNRYVFFYDGIELDISIRKLEKGTGIHDCAKERVMNADIGISSIAMAPDGTCWAHPQYLLDRDNNTLTLIRNKCIRTDEYVKRLSLKFPNMKIK